MVAKSSAGSDKNKSPKNPATNPAPQQELTLADLPVGSSATIVKIMPKLKSRQKFADVGIVPGSELLIESHALFGGLIRVKVMETSMALHKDDAANIVMNKKSVKKKNE